MLDDQEIPQLNCAPFDSMRCQIGQMICIPQIDPTCVAYDSVTFQTSLVFGAVSNFKQMVSIKSKS
jgi:hypothetical protein